MRVTLTKHGGFAAGIRRPPQVVDVDALPQTAATELTRLVNAAKTTSMAEGAGPGQARDAMSYTIMVENGGEPVILRQSDAAMSPAFADLLDWLERQAPTS